MSRQEKMKKSLLSQLFKLSERSAEKTANSTCFFWDFQPDMPKSVKQLSKCGKNDEESDTGSCK